MAPKIVMFESARFRAALADRRMSVRIWSNRTAYNQRKFRGKKNETNMDQQWSVDVVVLWWLLISFDFTYIGQFEPNMSLIVSSFAA